MTKINGTLDTYAYENNINYILIETTGQRNKQSFEVRITQLIEIFKQIIIYYTVSDINLNNIEIPADWSELIKQFIKS